MQDFLLQFLVNFSSQDPNVSQQAAQSLMEINTNPDFFIGYSDILGTPQDASIYNKCLIYLQSYVKRLGSDSFIQFIPQLLERVFQIIANAALPLNTKLYACDLINLLSQTKFDIGLEQIIVKFLENEATYIFVFRILETAYIALPDYDKYTSILINLFKTCIISASDDCKRCAISFFRSFIFNVDDPDVFSEDQELFTILLDQLNKAILENKGQHAQNLVSLITNFYNFHFTFFIEKYLAGFLQSAIEILQNENIPIQFRVIAHGLIPQEQETAISMIPEPLLKPFIYESIKLSYEVCNSMAEDSDDFSTDYMFNSVFIMSFCFENSKENFEFFMGVLQNLLSQNTPSAVQVFLYTTTNLVSIFPMYFYEMKETIIKLIHDSFESRNPLIIINANELILELIREIPFILQPIFNDISQLLLSNTLTDSNHFFHFLNEYLMYLPIVPSNLNDILQFCLGLLTRTEYEIRYKALSCLNNALRLYRPPDENLFQTLQIEQIMQDQLNQETIFDLIGTLVKVFPQSIKANLPTFIAYINIYPSEDVDYLLYSSRFICLRKIIRYFPETAANFCEVIQRVIEHGSQVIDSCKPDKSDSSEESAELHDQYHEMKIQFYLLMAATLRYLNLNQAVVYEYLKSKKADRAISIVANVMPDIDFVIKNYYPTFSNLSKLILLKGFGNSYDHICEELLSFLTREIFDDDLFTLINVVIKRGRQIPEPIIQFLFQLAGIEGFYPNGQLFQSLAYFSVFIQNDQIPTVFEQLCRLMEIEDQSQKLCVLRGINLILNYNPGIALATQIVLENAQKVLNDTYSSFDLINEAVVSCFLCLNYNCEIPHAKELFSKLNFEHSLNKMTFPHEEAFIVLTRAVSKFYQVDKTNFEQEILNITLIVISSENAFWMQIDEPIRNMMKAIVVSLDPALIANQLRHNEKRMKLLFTNMNA